MQNANTGMAQKQRAMEERERLMEEAGQGTDGENKAEEPYRSSLKTQENSGRYDDSQRYRKAKQN